MIKDDESKRINKLIKKFPSATIYSNNERLRGSFTIKRFRKYGLMHEVDIEFNGEIFARTSILDEFSWLKSDIISKKNVSKIKVNKLIKRHLLMDVRDYARYFGINVQWITNIKKITWKQD